MRRFIVLAAALAVGACAGPRPLAEADFLAIAPGMTPPQVRLAVGEPTRVEAFARLREVAWDYLLRDDWGYSAYRSVIFGPDGRVARMQHIRIEPDDQ